jgi:hypothetical protein
MDVKLEQSTNPRRDGRVVEGARLESVFRGNSNVGSNPTLSAMRLAGAVKHVKLESCRS